jgi:hypothetical protein
MKTGPFAASHRARAPHHASTASDPAFTPFVTASTDEIRIAQRLRDRLRERLLNRSSPAVSYWSVGAD